jgi:branched-chain amino acid transport system substrate-binding protein
MLKKLIAAAGVVLLFLPLVAQAAPETPVKIGVLGDQTGAYSAAGGKGSVEAARLAAEDAGMVLGKPVEIVSADFQLKVDVGVTIARKWYDEENVDTIIDVPFSVRISPGPDVLPMSRNGPTTAILLGEGRPAD